MRGREGGKDGQWEVEKERCTTGVELYTYVVHSCSDCACSVAYLSSTVCALQTGQPHSPALCSSASTMWPL